MPFLSPNQQCQSTKGNSKPWSYHWALNQTYTYITGGNFAKTLVLNYGFDYGMAISGDEKCFVMAYIMHRNSAVGETKTSVSNASIYDLVYSVVICCSSHVVLLHSVFWHCWLGIRKSIWPVKNWVMMCWHGYLTGARCKWFAYGPADATATRSSLASLKSRLV